MSHRKKLMVLAVALAASAAGAQVTSLPPICFGFNAGSPWMPYGPSLPVSTPGGFTVWFSAPLSTTVEVIDLPCTFAWSGPMMAVDLYVAPAIGVPPVTPSLGTFLPQDLGGWVPFKPPAPVSITQGGSYALTLTAIPLPGGTSGCSPVLYDPSAPSTLPYQMTAPSCTSSVPPSGMIGLIARFRGSSCGPGPLASSVVIGTQCGITVAGANTLTASYPALGMFWSVWLSSSPGTAYLFWAFGTNAAGSPIVPGSSCLHYLDPTSLTTLWSLGAEPLGQATFQYWQTLQWYVTLPSSPTFAGSVFGLQAVVIGPTGTIPLGPGVTAHTSNSLNVTLGYWYP